MIFKKEVLKFLDCTFSCLTGSQLNEAIATGKLGLGISNNLA
jgi:hypothetical protein